MKKIKTVTIAVVYFMATSFSLKAQDGDMDLYLLIGQSNMAGRGPLTPEYSAMGDTAVWMLDKDNQWVPAHHPVHFDKPKVAGVGPGLSFGIAMAHQGRKVHKVGLIPCAVGGTSIEVWVPGGYDKATQTHPYDDAMARLKAALPAGHLKGVIWLQGEADSNPERAAHYLDNLVALINRVREVAGDPTLPFVAGQLGRYKSQYANINAVLKKLPQTVAHTAVASSKGLTDKGDQTHFNAESATIYGKRFAKKMKHLEK